MSRLSYRGLKPINKSIGGVFPNPAFRIRELTKKCGIKIND
jgi:hypothetical protein